jgi:4-aminobutyrate aminotransferase-like enzyme
MALGLTGKNVPYKEGFGPFPKEIYHTTYPYVYRGVTTENAIEELDNLLSTKIKPEETAAIIIEPVLGEGGYIPCEKEFIQYLRNICDQNGIILIFDEVQTGFGRTGKMFGAEHFEVEPDIVTLAKGIAGGFPLASVTGKSDIMDSPKESGLGTTFGASPISCSAALGVLEAFDNENILDHSVLQGKVMRQKLDILLEENKYIGDVRGMGPMIGVEIVQNKKNKEPSKDTATKIVLKCKEEGLLLVTCGLDGNVIRFMGPLTTPIDQVEEAMDIFSRAVSSI